MTRLTCSTAQHASATKDDGVTLEDQVKARLARQASTDPLTGLLNHRTFHQRLRTEVRRAQRYGRALSLAVVDVDNFKHVNDLAGHETGDRLLAAVARRLGSVARTEDVFARIGGDEFALLTSRPIEETTLVCHRISRAVASESIHLSFGTTASPEDGTTAVELFRKADDRLFAAKLVSLNRRTVVELNRS